MRVLRGLYLWGVLCMCKRRTRMPVYNLCTPLQYVSCCFRTFTLVCLSGLFLYFGIHHFWVQWIHSLRWAWPIALFSHGCFRRYARYHTFRSLFFDVTQIETQNKQWPVRICRITIKLNVICKNFTYRPFLCKWPQFLSHASCHFNYILTVNVNLIFVQIYDHFLVIQMF